MNKEINNVIEFLEYCFIGARALDDYENMVKFSRAIAALKAPADMEIFTKKFQNWYIEKECEVKIPEKI